MRVVEKVIKGKPLSPDDKIIVSGLQRVRPGVEVKPEFEETTGTSATASAEPPPSSPAAPAKAGDAPRKQPAGG